VEPCRVGSKTRHSRAIQPNSGNINLTAFVIFAFAAGAAAAKFTRRVKNIDAIPEVMADGETRTLPWPRRAQSALANAAMPDDIL
jgi:hypothetical protein